MSTGYTREQIRQLEILIAQNTPPEQTAEQLNGAPTAIEIGLAGTGKGALIEFGFEHGVSHEFFLNCVIVLKFVIDLSGAAHEQNWWTFTERSQGIGGFSTPTDEEIWQATKVLSLRIDSAPDGALVSFGTGRTVSQFFVPKPVVHELLGDLRSLADHVGWWDDDMPLIPVDGERRNEEI